MPASADSALTVGAIDERDAKASYSNHGNDLEIYAPGSKYVRERGDLCLCGRVRGWLCGRWWTNLIWLAGRMDNNLGFGGWENKSDQFYHLYSIYSASNSGDTQYRTMSGTYGGSLKNH